MKIVKILGFSAFLALISEVAVAACLVGHCEPTQPIIHFDKPAKVKKDCSFTDAGDGWSSDFYGGSAANIGGGRVGQRLVLDAACVRSESVMVVDCNTKEFIQIRGVCTPPDPETAGFLGLYSADLLYPPRGQLKLNSNTRVEDLANLSKRAGYDHWDSSEDFMSRAKRKNRINPFCGCKLYYPDSPGAKL
ncbi:hypothetical protein [Ruegeria sp.]|uniref:hypothetical protein n=1 Tax=Ruegeria sp. TaxID=1879320 RepID=UPI003B5C3278